MNVETIRAVLLWSGIINYGLLLFWAALALFARPWLHRVGRWYGVAPEHSDAIQYIGIVLYKIGIIMFFFVPYVALRIAG